MKKLAVLALAASACAVEPIDLPTAPIARDTSVSLAALASEGAILGLSRKDGAFDVLVEGAGLVRVGDDGVELSRIAIGARGLVDRPYRDVASLGDDRYILLADNEGGLYEASAERQTVHFCVEPGFEDPVEPGELDLDQKNDAVAVQDGLIVAAPRFEDAASGALIESSLRTYRAADGAPLGSADVTSFGLALDGVALHDGALLGVVGDALHTFTLGGQQISQARLEGVERATGLTIEGDDLYVLDGASAEIVAFDVDAL